MTLKSHIENKRASMTRIDTASTEV